MDVTNPTIRDIFALVAAKTPGAEHVYIPDGGRGDPELREILAALGLAGAGGSLTEAVTAFQQRYNAGLCGCGTPLVEDGKAGPLTLAALQQSVRAQALRNAAITGSPQLSPAVEQFLGLEGGAPNLNAPPPQGAISGAALAAAMRGSSPEQVARMLLEQQIASNTGGQQVISAEGADTNWVVDEDGNLVANTKGGAVKGGGQTASSGAALGAGAAAAAAATAGLSSPAAQKLMGEAFAEKSAPRVALKQPLTEAGVTREAVNKALYAKGYTQGALWKETEDFQAFRTRIADRGMGKIVDGVTGGLRADTAAAAEAALSAKRDAFNQHFGKSNHTTFRWRSDEPFAKFQQRALDAGWSEQQIGRSVQNVRAGDVGIAEKGLADSRTAFNRAFTQKHNTSFGWKEGDSWATFQEKAAKKGWGTQVEKLGDELKIGEKVSQASAKASAFDDAFNPKAAPTSGWGGSGATTAPKVAKGVAGVSDDIVAQGSDDAAGHLASGVGGTMLRKIGENAGVIGQVINLGFGAKNIADGVQADAERGDGSHVERNRAIGETAGGAVGVWAGMAGGAVVGAKAGAVLGTFFGPGVGTFLGGVAGFGAGALIGMGAGMIGAEIGEAAS